MKLEEVITKRILDLCDERGLTTNKLATLAGLPSATIRYIFLWQKQKSGNEDIARYLSCFRNFSI